MRLVDTAAGAHALAQEILGPRTRPLILISTRDQDGGLAFAFDPDQVAREVGQDVDVVTIVTGETTRVLEKSMPEKTHAFGGAARSYPPDFGTAPEWWRSLLRFPDRHTVDELIGDALAQLTTVALRPVSERGRWVTATVERVSGATGNVARLDDGQQVIIVSDRLPPRVSLPAGLTKGDPIEGWLLGHDLAPEVAEVGLARFGDGSTTLARVVKVTDRRASLSLHPTLDDIALRRRDVIPGADDGENPDLNIADVVRIGETVRVRVTHSPQGLGLSLVDVDPAAPLIEALPILRGGSPWLREGVHADAAPVAPAGDDSTAAGADAATGAEATATAAAAAVPVEGSPAGGNGANQTASAALPLSRELQEIRDEVAGLRGTIGRLRHELRTGTDLETLDELRDEVTGLNAELHRERELRGEHKRMISHLTQELREARNARPVQESSDGHSPRDQWPDAESWLRHRILNAWAARMVAADKQRYPLPDYEIGPHFAPSLEALDAGQFTKALRAVVDALTGRAVEVSSRSIHRLRTGVGGDDPVVERTDGAKAWRVSIESNAPSARRLHYWELPGGRIELSRVVLHDDYTP